jgi:hypothetical protein
MQANEKEGLITKISKLVFTKKVRKYLPTTLTSIMALVFAAITGGLGLLIAGAIIAGIVYVQNLDAFWGEFKKKNIAKLNRPL